MGLYATGTEYSADSTEEVHGHLEDASKRALADEVIDAAMANVLEIIAHVGDLNDRTRRSVMDMRRAMSFLLRSQLLSTGQQDEARQALRDIDSVENHTAFLSDRVNFLVDVTVDLISINQNKVIKLFSVVPVVLVSPTLIASVYDMNFKAMPKLGWAGGYPYVIVMMVVSTAIPLVYFHRRGWLK